MSYKSSSLLPLEYEAKESFPGISFNNDTGELLVYGESYPEDAIEFFDPILDWIDEYNEDPYYNTVLDFKLSYYNSVSATYFLRLMNKMEDLKKMGYDVSIRWHYQENDVDSIKSGKEFRNLVNVDFLLVELTETPIEGDNLIDDIL